MSPVDVRIVDDPALAASLRRAWTEENAGPNQDAGPIEDAAPIQDAGPIEDAGFEAEFAAWWQQEAGHRTTWVAFLDEVPVGMLNLAEFRRMPRPGRPTGRWGYVANVFVLAAHRDAGIGARLLDAVIREARARDYVRLVLSPSERSIPFYRRAGFVDADELMLLPLRA